MIKDIYDGKLDNQLDQIVEAVRERRRTLARINLISVKVGDVIRFNELIRPTYLKGLTTKVVKVNGSSVTVQFDKNPVYGRFSGRRTRVPASLMERLT